MIPANHFPPQPAPAPLPHTHNHKSEAQSVAELNARIARRREQLGSAPSADDHRVMQRVGSSDRVHVPGPQLSGGPDRLVNVNGRPMLITSGSGAGLAFLLH